MNDIQYAQATFETYMSGNVSGAYQMYQSDPAGTGASFETVVSFWEKKAERIEKEKASDGWCGNWD